MAAGEISVTDSIDGYLKSKSGRSVSYLKDLTKTFRLVSGSVGDIQMRALREEHFAALFDRWQATLAPSTFNKNLGHVKQWLLYAARRRQLRLSPDELLVTVEPRRVIPRKRVYLSAIELLSLLDAAKHPRDRVYLALAMNTALRAGEIISLQLQDVDLDGGNLYVLRHKTGTRDVLPITTDLDQELRRWLRFYTEKVGVLKGEYYLVPAKYSTPILPGRQRLTQEDRDAVDLKPERRMKQDHQLMRTLLAQGGFPVEREGLHTIRRSVARVSYDYFQTQGETRDEALSVVQATLGHATQSITERYIGVERFREKRDRVMRAKPFLSAMIGNDDSNVRRLPSRGEGQSAG